MSGGADQGSSEKTTAAPAIPVGVLVRRLGALAWRHRWIALPTLLISTAAQLITILGLAGQGLAIDVIRSELDRSAPSPHWPLGLGPGADWGFLAKVGLVSGFILAVALVNAALRFSQRLTDELFVQACVVSLRSDLYDKLQRLPFSFFDTHDTGQVINRVAGDTQAVRAFIQGVMIRSVIAGITLAVFLVFMLRTHTWLTLACLSVLPFQVWLMTRYGRITKPKFLEQSRLVDVVVKTFQESIAGVRVIRAFGQERQMTERYDAHAGAARDQRIEIARDQGRYQPFVQASNFASMGVLLGFGGYLVHLGPVQGGIALGTLWIFRGLLEQLAGQAEAIVQIIASAPESLAGAERVFKMLDEPVKIASRPGARAPSPIRGRLEFRGVGFTYASRPPGERAESQFAPAGRAEEERPAVENPPALSGVSIAVSPGETIAVVGPVGSGKSTLLSLLGRFHDPTEGAVLVDGTDLRDWPLEALRASIGYVFQEPFLFSNTVRNNIAFGRPDATDDEVIAAAGAAGAWEFIERLPQGLSTVIGERGVSLSGGQRQRLTIARALLMRPPILVLDDATGAVDPVTEAEIQRALERYLSGRTTFVVAHRLSTLRRADRVLVLDGGRVADIGTHDELMNRPGHYRATALIQLSLDEDEPEGTGAGGPLPTEARG
ncbi:MAG: ABC transporter ATP-binding protein [Phycisphaerales bacterium]|nr:ABC transporter ATP-binding protein [Phycisphaerales bacterium]